MLSFRKPVTVVAMSPELVFRLVNAGALMAWVLLIVAPAWYVTRAVVRSGLWPAVLASAYLALLLIRLPQWPSDGSFSSLGGVAALFRDPWGLLTGWVHYLCFDLLVGLWIVGEAESRGITPVKRAPALVLTFLFGPVGWLAWLLTRRLAA